MDDNCGQTPPLVVHYLLFCYPQILLAKVKIHVTTFVIIALIDKRLTDCEYV